jgi:heme exporter protein B
LIAILVLPLYIPVLIFGSGAVVSSSSGLSPEGVLSLLGALLVMGIVFVPYVVSAALRVALE